MKRINQFSILFTDYENRAAAFFSDQMCDGWDDDLSLPLALAALDRQFPNLSEDFLNYLADKESEYSRQRDEDN